MRWRRRQEVLAVHGNRKIKSVVRLLDPGKPVLLVPEKHPLLRQLRSESDGKRSLRDRLWECRKFFGGLFTGKRRRRAFNEAVRRETPAQEEILKQLKWTNDSLAAPVDMFETDKNTVVVVRERTFAQHKAMVETLKKFGLAENGIEKLQKSEWGFIPDLSYCVGSNGLVKTSDNHLLFTVRADKDRIDASPNQLAPSWSGPPRWKEMGQKAGESQPTFLQAFDIQRSAKELGIDASHVIPASHKTFMVGTQADGGPTLLSYMELNMTKDELLRASEQAAEKWQSSKLFSVELTEAAIRERLAPDHSESLVREGAYWFAPALIGACQLKFGPDFAAEVAQGLAGESLRFQLNQGR